MRAKLIFTGVALALGMASCRDGSEPPARAALSAQDLRAIAAAEEFLRKYGYTDQPHDPATLEEESRSSGWPVEQLLRMRRNMTLGKAYGLSKGKATRPGWTVYFEYNPAFLRELEASMKFFRQPEEVLAPGGGMSVEVSPDFSQLVVPHMDICLPTAQVVLRPPPQDRETRPASVPAWAVPGVEDLREVIVSRFLGSSCADLPGPTWPLCIQVEDPVFRPRVADNPCGADGIDSRYASNELVARLKRSAKRRVLSATECIDLPSRARNLVLTIHPLRRQRTEDAELLVYVTMYSPEPLGSDVGSQYVEMEATAILQRTGWVLSNSRIEFLELPPRESTDRVTRTADCS